MKLPCTASATMDSSFQLPFDISDKLFDGLTNDVVIVSVIGKSALGSSTKVNSLYDTLGSRIFTKIDFSNFQSDKDIMCCIDGFYDSELQTIFLQLCGSLDADYLISSYQKLGADLEEKGFFHVWATLEHRYTRALLFLFSVSHIIILSHPGAVFDSNYINLFKVLDAVRVKLKSSLSEVLKSVGGLNPLWISSGRLCSPRVLFYFQDCPEIFRKTSRVPNYKGLYIKKFEHALEDQIYRILRKSRVITNYSANSLFAIPPNQEFVYVQTDIKPSHDWSSYIVNYITDYCDSRKQDTKFLPPAVESNHCSFGFESLPNYENSDAEHNILEFLTQHVNQALHEGFDDNVGRYPSYPSQNQFVLPTVKLWFQAANKLHTFLIGKDEKSAGVLKLDQSITGLFELLDTDVKFSEARCSKVLPLALATYQEGLPLHYTRDYHESRVAHAISVFGIHARGPLLDTYVIKLENECDRFWRNGRQMCEVLSLTGNPCMNPLHKGGLTDAFIPESEPSNQSAADLPMMDHASGVVYMSTCNCGRRQGAREDPFTLRSANYEFYQLLALECTCLALDRFDFPVFQPSTKDYRAAQLFTNNSQSQSQKESSGSSSSKGNKEPATSTQLQSNTQDLSLAFVSGQSVSCPEESGERADLQSHAETPSEYQQIVIQVSNSEADNSKDKSLVRQPSTTEYLPGMLHSESPPGLLPQFPSWSLVCLGPSSVYSHSAGLQEQLQIGFLGGSAHLLPWDVAVRLENQLFKERWQNFDDRNKSGNNTRCRKNKGGKESAEFTVKIFVGVEYECPKGHRFMCAGPDKILKSSPGGHVKDNGNKVTSSDMPLYFPCPCRNSKPLIAQLMRLHVVTPKAPVHVTLNPRVQPASSPCPTFITGCQEPIRLSQSAYWVLRLPYVYAGDRGPYLPPKESPPSNCGRLLAGVYGITEIAVESKREANPT
ncbi:unnamed protein product [Bemisia tabaci]|uniref:Nonsense-mediated mRNA decay factor SMG8 n=1 Tax=Bemisia tabaci TaxID=7038 RepID=A0A9P0AID2_BEMTA|nr:PREDICTED: protein SMG8 [Bemisia tabaci]CAH0392401.1 unnamed protein product [Bemisia tabaci]